MILQVIFTISNGQESVERGFSLNKNLLAENMKVLIDYSVSLFDQKSPSFQQVVFLTLWSYLTNCWSRLKMLDRALRATCKKTDKKQQHGKGQQKHIVESEINEIEGQMQGVQKIIEGLEKNFFAFVEDAEKKKDLPLLSTVNAIKRKAEETKQDMTKLEETVALKKKQKRIYIIKGQLHITCMDVFYYTGFIGICVWC